MQIERHRQCNICSFFEKKWKWIIGIGIILGIIISIIAIRSCHDGLNKQPSTESKTYSVSPFEYRNISSKERIINELEDADSILIDMQKKLEVGLSGLNLTLVNDKSHTYPNTQEEFMKMTKDQLPVPYNNYFYTKIACESDDDVTITCRHIKKGGKIVIQIHDTTFRMNDLKDTYSRNALMELFANRIIRKIKDREKIEKIENEFKLLIETTDKKEFIKRSDRIETYLNELSGTARDNFFRLHSDEITDMRERASSYK